MAHVDVAHIMQPIARVYRANEQWRFYSAGREIDSPMTTMLDVARLAEKRAQWIIYLGDQSSLAEFSLRLVDPVAEMLMMQFEEIGSFVSRSTRKGVVEQSHSLWRSLEVSGFVNEVATGNLVVLYCFSKADSLDRFEINGALLENLRLNKKVVARMDDWVVRASGGLVPENVFAMKWKHLKKLFWLIDHTITRCQDHEIESILGAWGVSVKDWVAA